MQTKKNLLFLFSLFFKVVFGRFGVSRECSHNMMQNCTHLLFNSQEGYFYTENLFISKSKLSCESSVVALV